MVVIVLIMTAPATQCYYNRESLPSSAGAADSLLIVESHWRHVREHYRLQASNVHADFHSRRNAQDVDLVDVLKKLPGSTNINDDIPKESLAFGLIICLRSQFFRMQTKRRAALCRFLG